MENAKNKRSKGIMQVNNGPWDLAENMKAGVKLLREYFEMLGNKKAAILAYNCGPANYIKGRCRNINYYVKVKEHVRGYESWLEEHPDASNGLVSGTAPGSADVQTDPSGVLLPEDQPSGGYRESGEENCSDFQNCSSETVRENLGTVKE